MPRRPKKPQPRRTRNSGSVMARPDGTFWAIPPSWVESKRKPTRGFASRAEAGAWLDARCAEKRTGGPIASDLTVDRWVGAWYDRVADSANWAPSTRATVAVRLRNFAPIAAVRLVDLRPSQVQDVVAMMARRGLSAAVINQAASLIRRALADAHEDGLVPRNVAARLTLPKVRRAQPRAWTQAEAQALLLAAEGEPLEALVGLGMILGLRIGEILALRWDDINMSRTTLTVQRSYSGGRLGPTKTRRDRTVGLPLRVWAALLRLREQQPPGTAWLFPSPQKRDRPLSYPHARKWLGRMIERAGIRPLASHSLRHSAATAMLSNGVQPPDVARQLGHANPGVTLSTYWSPSGDSTDPAQTVSDWLDRGTNDPK